MMGYGTREVAQILGLSAAQVRSYVRAGFLSPGRGPRGQFRFSFPDLVFLRSARGLLEARIPPRRIRRTLRKLAGELPESGSLANLRIAAEGGRIVVGDGTSRWQAESGQRLLDFGADGIAAEVSPLARENAGEAAAEAGLDAQDWYELGCGLESGAPEQAGEAYERALRLDPNHADAHVNLGRLLHERGAPAAARAHYEAATLARPDDATAAFNLGVALEDLGHDAEALEAYERAIGIDPGDADAFFNAANLCERVRDTASALAYWRTYQKLTRPER